MSTFLLTLFKPRAWREGRLHNFYLSDNLWESAPTLHYVGLQDGRSAGLAASTPAPLSCLGDPYLFPRLRLCVIRGQLPMLVLCLRTLRQRLLAVFPLHTLPQGAGLSHSSGDLHSRSRVWVCKHFYLPTRLPSSEIFVFLFCFKSQKWK